MPASRAAVISVVIPTFRRLERLPILLARLADVDRAGEMDVVIVDQTPQADLSALQGFATHFSSFRCLSLAKANVAMARNVGAEAASCDALLFLDDDMELEKSYVCVLLSLMREAPRTAFGGVWPGQDEIGREDGRPPAGRGDDSLIFLPTGALALHRSDFIAAGGFDARLERNFEDAELSHRLKRRGLRLIRHPQLRAFHHDRRENGSWYSRSLTKTASQLMRQTAYFRRKTGRTWPQVMLALLRVVASEARRPGYLVGGTRFSRMLALGMSLPAAVAYASRHPLLIDALPQIEGSS